MRTRLVAPVVLLAVVLAAAPLVLAARPSREHTVIFDEVLGLTEGAEVHAGGETVGKVGSIRLGRDGFPLVRIEIDDEIRLHRGATAALSLFSGAGVERRYIALENGAGPDLGDGAVLGRSTTDGPVESDAALATLDPATRRDVVRLVDRADGALRGRGPALDRTLASAGAALAETANLVDDVARDGQALRTLVGEGRRVSGALASRRNSLGGAVEGLGTTLETTAARRRAVAATLEALPPTLRTARGALERAEGAIPELRGLVRTARPGVRELVPTAAALRPTLSAARPALEQGRRLVRAAPADLRPVDALLGEVGPTLRPARSALDRANPMLDELRVRTPEAAASAILFADAASNFDRNGHALRSAGVFAEPPRERVGPSEAQTGRLVRPFTRTPGVLEGEPWRSFRESFVGGGGR